MAVLERVHHGQEVQAIAEVIKDLAIAADSAQKLEKVLVGLLDSQPVLCVLETVVVKGDRPPTAVVRMAGQQVSLPIHPAVDIEALRKLRKWECVLVAQKEMLVVGVWADDDYLWTQAQGEVVEFRAYCRGPQRHGLGDPPGPQRSDRQPRSAALRAGAAARHVAGAAPQRAELGHLAVVEGEGAIEVPRAHRLHRYDPRRPGRPGADRRTAAGKDLHSCRVPRACATSSRSIPCGA